MSIRQLTAKELQADSIRMAKANRDKNDSMDAQFFNADGFCSAYAHACGYEDSLLKENLSLHLWYESECYHVRLVIGNLRTGLLTTAWYSCHSSEDRARSRAKTAFKALRRFALAHDVPPSIVDMNQYRHDVKQVLFNLNIGYDGA